MQFQPVLAPVNGLGQRVAKILELHPVLHGRFCLVHLAYLDGYGLDVPEYRLGFHVGLLGAGLRV